MFLILSLVLAIVFVALGALHVAWGLGSPWPAADGPSLARLVVGVGPGQAMPGRGACVAVAAGLSGAAVAVVALGFGAQVPGLVGVVRLVGAALLARGLGGFVEARLRPEIVGTPYAAWNVRLYSPLCLALAAGVLGLSWRP